MTTLLNTTAEHWFAWQFAMLWQTAVLIAILWMADVLIRKWAWPQMRYALWMLVLVKLLIPPTFTSPASITSRIPAAAQKAVQIQFAPTVTPSSSRQLNTQQTDSAITDVQPAGAKPVDADSIGAATIMERLGADVPSLSWKAWSMFIWLFGIAILSIWLILRLSGLRKEHLIRDGWHGQAMSRAKSRDPLGRGLTERFNEQLQTAAQKLNLKRLPQVILTDKVSCPAVFGVFRPVLLMPAEKFKTMSARDTEHVLLHELAHIKRGDLWVHAVYMMLQILYWFNPLLWIIRRTLQNLRELCCDATVAKLLREDTVHYRQTLLETARQLLAEPVDPGLGLLGLFENSNWLVARLQWLEKNTWKNRPLRIATIFILVAIMTACVLPMANKPKDSVKSTTQAQRWVEDFFRHNYLDIRTRKTLEWGEPVLHENGNISIRYKYEATIVNGKIIVSDEIFTFDKQGKFVSVRKVGAEDIYSLAGAQGLVEDFFANNYRDITKRETIEWGQPVKYDNGNVSIRYKYEATIWDKDKKINDQIFTFDKDGKYVSVENSPEGEEISNQKTEAASASDPIKENSGLTAAIDNNSVSVDTFETIMESYNLQKKEQKSSSLSLNVPPMNITFKKDMQRLDALQMLAKMYKINIIPSDAVNGYNPATELYDVTFEEALKAVCGTTHTYVIKGDFVYVYTNEEYAALPKEITLEQAQKAIAAFWAGKNSIESFKPLEWGEMLDRDDGTQSLRCKYELTFWGKDEKQISDSMFFFDKTGKVDELINLQGNTYINATDSQPSGENQKNHTVLYDWKKRHLALDLATGEEVEYIVDQYKEKSDQIEYVKRMDKGDLLYSDWAGDLVVLRKGYAMLWDGKVTKSIGLNYDAERYLTVYHIPRPPCRLLVTTAEGKQFDVKILRLAKMADGVEIEYHPVEKAKGEMETEGNIDITPADFKLHFDEERKTYSLIVSIKNSNDVAIPNFKLRFYRGNYGVFDKGLDETSNQPSGWHEVGPIQPGQTWNERTRDFGISDGDYTFTAVLDYDNAIPETNEANNRATLDVTIKDGQVVEKTEGKMQPLGTRASRSL